MAKTKRERYLGELDNISNHDEISDEDKELILAFLKANDPKSNTYAMPEGETKSDGTLARYGFACRHVAADLENGLANATAFEINDLMDKYQNGTIDSVKDGGLSGGSVKNRQSPLRVFYRYHEQLGVEPEDITLADNEGKSVDERDMFTKEDVLALRQTAANYGVRDRCLVDLLLYTGQRKSALLNLRLKDIDTNDEVFYLNEDAGDLKGASGKRPLLGAANAVQEWVANHPTGEPDDYLITTKYDFSNDDRKTAGGRLDGSTVHRQLQRIGDAAGVDKPVNAHNFRHYFVTVCYRDYDMDGDTIKHLIGHHPESKVMETTYKHLTDDDYIQAAERATGKREDTRDSPLTPPLCDRCKEPLEGDWRTCPYCGLSYGPDADSIEGTIDDATHESKAETAAAGDEDAEAGVDLVREVMDDEEAKNEIMAEMKDELLAEMRKEMGD